MSSKSKLSALLGTNKEKIEFVLEMTSEEVNTLARTILSRSPEELDVKDVDGITPFHVLIKLVENPLLYTRNLEEIFFLNPDNNKNIFSRSFNRFCATVMRHPSRTLQTTVLTFDNLVFKPHLEVDTLANFPPAYKSHLAQHFLHSLPTYYLALRELPYNFFNTTIITYCQALDISEDQLMPYYKQLLIKRSKYHIAKQNEDYSREMFKPVALPEETFKLLEKLNFLVQEQYNQLTREQINNVLNLNSLRSSSPKPKVD